jgi:hypothetical protein
MAEESIEKISEALSSYGAVSMIKTDVLVDSFCTSISNASLSTIHDLSPSSMKALRADIENDKNEIVEKFKGWTLQDDPFGFSVGKESTPDSNSSWRAGLGGLNGVRPELFHRTEQQISIPSKDGSHEHVTNSFLDVGYLNAEISNPGDRGNIYHDPLSEHQKNAEYFGARIFKQHFDNSDSALYSTASAGMATDGSAIAESTIAYTYKAGEWDLSSAAQASYTSDTPQLDIKLEAERYFNAPEIHGKFSAAAQGTINPDREFVTGVAEINLRPKDWENGESWIERRLSASFNVKSQFEDGDINNKFGTGLYVDVPFGRAGVQYDNGDAVSLVYTQSF